MLLLLTVVFPVIVVQPVSASITAGSIDTITCTARGFPFNDIYWQKNGQNITDIIETASYSQSVSEPNNADLTVVGTLTINGPVLSTEGNFSCIAKNYLVTLEEAFSNKVEIYVHCECVLLLYMTSLHVIVLDYFCNLMYIKL